MNFCLSADSVSLRISVEEARKVLEGVELQEQTCFPMGGRIVVEVTTFEVATEESPELQDELQDERQSLRLHWSVPVVKFSVEKKRLELLLEEESLHGGTIEADLPLPSGKFVHVIFEVGLPASAVEERWL